MKVLDKGHVELVDHMGSDTRVLNAAKVSFSKHVDESLPFKDPRDLIGYLARNKHWTPFAHCFVTLRVKAPISIRTQLFKHKIGLVENEVSRRYVKDEPEYYVPQWRGAPTDGAKQGSSGPITDQDLYGQCNDNYKLLADQAVINYHNLLRMGVAPEQARFALPQGMYTEWYWSGSLLAFARVYQQRIDGHAQWEVQQYAKAIDEIIRPLFPRCWEALVGNSTD